MTAVRFLYLRWEKPVKIADMARRMIECSGFVPDKEIKSFIPVYVPGKSYTRSC